MFQQYFFNNEDFMIYHQNICGLTNKTNEIVTSLYLKFPQIICFVEHHLKYMQIQQISIENCDLGMSICSVSSDKGGVCTRAFFFSTSDRASKEVRNTQEPDLRVA